MPIIKYDPFKEIERFFDDDFPFGFVPAVKRHMEPMMDVYQTEKELVVELSVPKMDPSKLHISVEDSVLKIEGSHTEEKETDNKSYFRKEMRTGSFVRAFTLPVPVKEDEAKAEYQNGMLKITIPKVEAKQPKRVEVEVKQ